jgi:uracil-DNA glycosylase
LLNTALTVRHSKPGSHSAFGWTPFAEGVLRAVARHHRNRGVVVLAWGLHAQRVASLFPLHLPDPGHKGDLQGVGRHVVLEAPHPSGRNQNSSFLGCAFASRCNAFLADRGIAPITWQT